MPTVTLNKKIFEQLVGKKLPIEKLKDRISMLGTDLESIEGDEIKVEIFPNRPDMLSEQGFARAFSSFIGVKTGLRKYNVKKSNAKIIVEESVAEYRPCSAAAIVKGIKFTDELIREIMQNQEKIHKTLGRDRTKVALGYYILDKVKFPVKYKAEDPKKIKFQPLHFPKEINGMQILSQHPMGREFGNQLEGFDKFPVYYDSFGKVLSMPPIINSDEAGNVVPGACDVLVECSGFDQRTLNIALNISVTTLADMGGEIYSVEIKYPDKKIVTPDLSPKKWKINLDFINKWLGLELKEKDLKKLLEKMGFGYEKGHVLVPAYRADIMHEVDFAEDIAISYGYENFKEEIPNVATTGEEDPLEIFKRKVVETLVGLGLLELNTYNLTSEDIQNKLMNVNFDLIEMANAVSTEYDVVRAWMIPGLLEVFKNNKHHEYPQRIFDMGVVFKKDKKGITETGAVEMTRLAVGLCEEKADFTKIKQIFDYLMRMLDVEYKMREVEHPSFITGRVARVSVKGKDVAYIGEIHPQVLVNFDLDVPVTVFELNLTELFELL